MQRDVFALINSTGRLDDLYDRAMSLAVAGAWECDLRSDALTWTQGVFDLFGIPADTKVERDDIVQMYCEESREAMERLRAEAVAWGRGFKLDARIVRTDGAVRWMRLTAGTRSCRGRPTYLYGLKQDITEDRVRWETLRRQTEQDPLTGLANRRLFQSRFLDLPKFAPIMAPLGALILFDLAGLKKINDDLGYAAGDACLEATGTRLSIGFPEALMVARIGGDAFAVLLADQPRPVLEQKAKALLDCVSAPICWRGTLLDISTAAGMSFAESPWAFDAEEMFALADGALCEAKRSGRGTSRMAFGAMPGAEKSTSLKQ